MALAVKEMADKIENQCYMMVDKLDYPKEEKPLDERLALENEIHNNLTDYVPKWRDLINFATKHLQYNYHKHGKARIYIDNHLKDLPTDALTELSHILAEEGK